MAAALAADELGLSTLIVEKTEYVGGSMSLSGGAFWIPDNPVLRAEGAGDSIDRAEQYLRTIVADSAGEERWSSYLQHGPATVELLQRATPLQFMWSRGYSDYHAEQPGGSAVGRTCESKPFDLSVLGTHRDRLRPTGLSAPLPMPLTGVDYRLLNLLTSIPARAFPRAVRRVAQGVGGKVAGREYTAGGQALAGGLYAGVLDKHIPVWRNTQLVRVTSDDERVNGVVLARGDGEEVTVTARRGVVLAAGGFDHNMAKRHEYQSAALGEWTMGAPGNTGDAIDVARQVGAATDLLDQAWWFPAVAPLPDKKPKVMLAERSLPGSFIVDSAGRRFIDESADYMTFGQRVLARERAGDPVGQMWIVFDQEYRNSYVFAGELFPRMAIPDSWFSAGIAHSAETLPELATKTGLPKLADTTERFNTLAAAGTDDDFRRGTTPYGRYYGDPTQSPNPTLRPLRKAPFYAVKMVLSDLGTCGGIATDEFGQALSTDGSVIDGLYAAGNTAANAFGDRYPGAGATIGQGLVFGYIAAQHASGNI